MNALWIRYVLKAVKVGRFEVLMEMNIATVALWDMTLLCRLEGNYQNFFFCPIKMKAAGSSKTLVTMYL
jgi:hypothetical protein